MGQNLRKTILLPLSLTWVLLVGSFLLAFHQTQRSFLKQEIATANQTAHHYFNRILANEANRQESFLILLAADHAVQDGLRNEDQQALLAKAREILAQGTAQTTVNHIHFYRPDLKPLLEHHNAARDGENPVSPLLQQARATRRMAYGLGLDPLGTLTFWMVTPCQDHRHTLLGYIQLGAPVNFFQPDAPDQDTNGAARSRFHFQSLILLDKKFLDREKWETGMRLAGHTPHWEQLPREVVVNQTFALDPAATAALSETPPDATVTTRINNRYHQVTNHPIFDGQQRQVGHILIFADINDRVDSSQQTLTMVIAIALVLGALLFLLTNFILKNAEQRLATFRQKLIQESESANAAKEQHVQEMQRAWQYLQNIIECIGNPLLVVNRDYRIVLANRSVRDTVTAAQQPLEMMHCWDIFPPAEGAASEGRCGLQCRSRECPVQQVFLSRQTSELTHTVHRDNGTSFTSRTMAWPVVDEQNEIIQVALVFHDITPLKNTEEQLRWESTVNQAMAELAQSFIAPRMTIDAISTLVMTKVREITASRDGFVGYLEPRTGHLVLPAMDEERQTRFEEFSGLWGWVLENRLPLLTNEAAQDDRAAAGLPSGEIPIHNFLAVPAIIEDELVGEIALANSAHPYSRRDQLALEQFAVLYAIAIQRQRWEDELARSREEAIAANRGKDQFIANMSHELRTPLNGILGMTDLLLATELDEKQATHLSMSKSAATALLRIINDILDYSKVAANQLSLMEVPFAPRELLKETTDFFSLETSAKGLALNCRIAEDTPALLRGDPGRLRQILVNLIGNAVKFTEQGEVTVEVRPLAEEATAGMQTTGRTVLRFTVRDTGIGIPHDKMAGLFQEFTQVDGSLTRKYGGTGLGLSFSRKLAELMGGRIELHSEEGVGSTFSCDLPFLPAREAAPSEEAAGAGKSSPSRSAPRQSERPLNILLAEDDLINREVAMAYLQRRNCRVTVAHDGQAAVDAFLKDTYDLALIDVQMPQLDGLEATARIRKLEQSGGHTPIIALTAHTLQGYREKCLTAGMDDFLAKPLTAESLYAVIEKYVYRNAPAPPADTDPAPRTDTPEGNSIDLDLMRRALHNNNDLLKKLTDHFAATIPLQMNELRQHLAHDNGEGVREVAHAIKGTLLNFGAHAAATLAKKLESLGMANNLTGAATVLAELTAELDRVQQALAQSSEQST